MGVARNAEQALEPSRVATQLKLGDDPDADDERLDDVLHSGRLGEGLYQLAELRKKEGTERGADDAAAAPGEGRTTEHHRGDRGQEVVVAGREGRGAQQAAASAVDNQYAETM